MNIPILRGRVFDETDGASTPEVAVISKRVADSVWPGQDPIGRRINYANFDGDRKFMTIVGIVGDVRNAPETPALGDVYVHYLQRGSLAGFSVIVHASGSADALAGAVAAELRSLNPEASVRVRTLDEMFTSSTADRRFTFALLTTFAACALMLALAGVYSVIAYSVSQRNQEIGIRMALGARPGSIAGLFLAEGLWMIVAGGLLGVAAAAAASRLLRSLLFGVQPGDAAAYMIAMTVVILAGLPATLVPAHRAAQVDAMTTIRES